MFVAGCPTFSLSVFIQDEQAEKKNTFRMEHYLTITPDLHCVVCTLSGIKTFIHIHILMAGVMQHMRCTCVVVVVALDYSELLLSLAAVIIIIILLEYLRPMITIDPIPTIHPSHPSIPSTYSIEDDLSQLR